MASTYVPPEGLLSSASLAIVGEQPGRTEVVKRRPFVGPAGEVLRDCLSRAGINAGDCYFTNVVKDLDAPITSYIDLTGSNVQISDKGREYIDSLHREIQNLKAEVIVVTGNVPLYALTNRRGITKWRGSVLHDVIPGKIIIPAIHPATVIPPKNQPLNRHLITFDLKKARDVMIGEYQKPDYKCFIRPTFDQVMDYLTHVENLGKQGYHVAYDIEIYNMQVSCIGFGSRDLEAMCIPFVHGSGDYFGVREEGIIWRRIASILENKRIRKLGQNIVFDSHFLLRRYGIHVHETDDTMIAQQILMPDYPKGLDFIASIWTNVPYYKDEGKHWFKVGGAWERLWQYNCYDVITCIEAFPKQVFDLRRQGNAITYERQRFCIEPCCFMMEHGTRVDPIALKSAYSDRINAAAESEKKLKELAGDDFNPRSTPQLKKLFYQTLGYKQYTKNGKATTDVNAIKRLKRQGCVEAELLQSIRRNQKLASTYLHPSKFDEDYRLRCSYNPVGTRYSRFSSGKSIFGTGMNMQNWPHELLDFLQPDEGFMYFSPDLSQAENRIVAYVGQVDTMIDAFESGKDLHRLTASLIFDKAYEDVSDEPGSCTLGDGTQSERFWGKKANHGLNYDLGYKSFALYYEIPEQQGKWIIDRYHEAYPGVRKSYHAHVKSSLRETRMLTNLMGRKTMFLGPLDDTTFKEAYSCIPQGSAGDIINERGLQYIYYNQERFGPIALLNQVHDSIGVQIPVPPLCSWLEVADMVQAIKNSLETPLITHWGRKFVIPVDFSVSLTLRKESGSELKAKKWPSSIPELADKIESIYYELLERKDGQSA